MANGKIAMVGVLANHPRFLQVGVLANHPRFLQVGVLANRGKSSMAMVGIIRDLRY